MGLPFRLMGIVNVTPDSFSDGGLFLDAEAAVAHGRELVSQGADILDIGGESTRPGAEPVGEEEELRRVVPVIESLSEGDTQISIDTSKAAVARAALAAGATLVNDVSAFRHDSEMAEVVAESGVECCLMHMLGEPRTMQRAGGPQYRDVVDDVKSFLEERLRFAVHAGVAEERVLLDPGIGFGKTVGHNLQLLRRLHELTALGRPLVVGTSRKSFLGRLIADAGVGRKPAGVGEGSAEGAGRLAEAANRPADIAERLPGTIATSVIAYQQGATVFRVHDVAPLHAALAVAAATLA
jgi:dihydropteroate synthase